MNAGAATSPGAVLSCLALLLLAAGAACSSGNVRQRAGVVDASDPLVTPPYMEERPVPGSLSATQRPQPIR